MMLVSEARPTKSPSRRIACRMKSRIGSLFSSFFPLDFGRHANASHRMRAALMSSCLLRRKARLVSNSSPRMINSDRNPQRDEGSTPVLATCRGCAARLGGDPI